MRMVPSRCALALATGLAALVAAAQEVTLPLDRYNELRLRSSPPPTPTPPPPAPWALESAAIEVTAGDKSATVTTRLVLSLFATDWQQLSLPPIGRLLATDLGTLEGRVAAGDSWALHVKGTGRHVIEFRSVLELEENEGATRPERSGALRLPPAAVVTGTVGVGAAVEDVEFAGATGTGRDTRGRFTFVGRPGTEVTVTLLGKATVAAKEQLPLRFSATVSTLTTVSRTRTQVRGFVSARVRQGRLDSLRVQLPPSLTVVSVTGDPIGGWDIDAGRLVVTPAAPAERQFSCEIALTGDTRTEFAAPLLRVDGAARQSLGTAVQVEGDGLLELLTAESGRPPDERERTGLPDAFRTAARFPMVVGDEAHPPRWAVTWPEKGEVLAAQVDRLAVDVLAGDSGLAAYQCWVEVRNAGATSLTLAMPDGFELVDASTGTQRLTPGRSPEGLVVPLVAGTGAQVIHVNGLLPVTVPRRDGSLVVPLPGLSAPVGRVEFRLVLPSGRSYAAKGVEPLPSLAVGLAGGIPPARWNQIAQQVQVTNAATNVAGATLFDVPPGHATVHGRWSALSARPAPIQVEVEELSTKWGWF